MTNRWEINYTEMISVYCSYHKARFIFVYVYGLTNTYRHGSHGGRIRGTGQTQIVFGDVLAGTHNGTFIPAEALLRSIWELNGIDIQYQWLSALGVESCCPALLLGLTVRVMEVQAGCSTLTLLTKSTSQIIIPEKGIHI